MTSSFSRRTALAAPFAALAAPALAQAGFPNRSLRFVVPWPAGGSADTHMRVLAEVASEQLRQPVVVDNRPGASGTLGPASIAQETRADGYLFGQMPVSIFRYPAMTRRSTFDPMTDFSWIIHLTGYCFGVVVRADSRYNTWEELLDYAKANPGKVSYGSPGVGSSLHITMERIGADRGIEFLHVPFRGSAETTQALLQGSVDCVADSTGWAPMVQEGRFRLLVVWSEQRAKRFPDVPTLREVGIDIVSDSPYGLAGPKNMDPGVVRVLHDALKIALHDPRHLAVLERFDMPVRYMDTATYTAFAQRTHAEEVAMVRRMNLRID